MSPRKARRTLRGAPLQSIGPAPAPLMLAGPRLDAIRITDPEHAEGPKAGVTLGARESAPAEVPSSRW